MFRRTVTQRFSFLGARAAALTARFLSPGLCAAPGTAESKDRQPGAQGLQGDCGRLASVSKVICRAGLP